MQRMMQGMGMENKRSMPKEHAPEKTPTNPVPHTPVPHQTSPQDIPSNSPNERPSSPSNPGVAKKASPGQHVPVNDNMAGMSRQLLHQPARSRRDSWEAMMQQGSQQNPQGDKLAAAGSAKNYDSVEHGGPSSAQRTVWDQIIKAKPSPNLHANPGDPLASDRRKSFERAAANVANTRRGVSLDLAKPVYVPAGLKQEAHPQGETSSEPWGSVFNPGRNPRMKEEGSTKFDKPARAEDTVWVQINKSSNHE